MSAQVVLAAATADKVRLSRSATAGANGLAVQLIDVSRAGMGFTSPIYLPPGCKLKVTVQPPVGEILLLEASLARVLMIDRKPTYLFGTLTDAASVPVLEQLIEVAIRQAAAGAANSQASKEAA